MLSAYWIIILIFLGLFAYVSNHKLNWRDWLLEVGILIEALIDGGQTRYIISEGNEINPFVGRHGEKMEYWHFGILAFITQFLVAKLLPATWRLAFLGFCLGLEGCVIYANFIRGAYPW